MRIKPKENYKLVNYPKITAIDKNKVYDAIIATNQPDYKEKGLIFVNDLLLSKNEYIIIEGSK